MTHSVPLTVLQLRLSDGMLEALKFLALLLMTLDHVNRFVLDGGMPAFFYLGRLAFPLFAAVLGWNLARPGLIESDAGLRVLKRLLLFGAIATIPYAGMLGYQWWRLNILFTLGAGTAVILLISKGRASCMILAAVLFAASGAVVDYAWYGVAVCVASWMVCKRPTWMSLLAWIAALASLAVINGNYIALLAAPLLCCAAGKDLHFPRWRNFFYWFYPLHLFVLGLLARAG